MKITHMSMIEKKMRKGAKSFRKRSREVTDPLDRWEKLIKRTKRLLAGTTDDDEIDALFDEERSVLLNANDQKRVPKLCQEIIKVLRQQEKEIRKLRGHLKSTDEASLRFQRRLIEDCKRSMIAGAPVTEPNQRLHTIVWTQQSLEPVRKVKRRKKPTTNNS